MMYGLRSKNRNYIVEEKYKKIFAFMAKIIYKLSTGQDISNNEIQSLDNIMSELDVELDENEFRY